MLHRLVFFLSAVVLVGCATEQRLGESRVQSRRYTKGFHVQHHRNVQRPPIDGVAVASAGAGKGVAEVSKTEFESVQIKGIHAIESVEKTGLSGPKWPHSDRTDIPFMKPLMASEVSQAARPVLVSSKLLPSPIHGRHPNAVPGFILSIGWFLGIIGEVAVDQLDMPIAGFPILLGLVASVLGYVVSRKAYRTSVDHPELYPRFRLASAARFVALGFLAPVALYIALALVVIIALGGF